MLKEWVWIWQLWNLTLKTAINKYNWNMCQKTNKWQFIKHLSSVIKNTSTNSLWTNQYFLSKEKNEGHIPLNLIERKIKSNLEEESNCVRFGCYSDKVSVKPDR